MKTLTCAVVLFAFILAGCGPAFLPGRTTRKVTRADVAGVWQYPAEYRKTRVVIELFVDGNFVQTVNRPEGFGSQSCCGTWDVVDAYPVMKLLKPDKADANAPWIMDDVHWWVIDSELHPGAFAICGAADDSDPDNCFEMDKLR